MSAPDSMHDLVPAKDFIAISVNAVHWYADLLDMLTSAREFRVVPATFVDRNRHLLTPGFDANWVIDSLWQTEERVDEAHLLVWISRVLDRSRQRIEQHISRLSGEVGGATAPASLAVLSGFQIDSYEELYGVLSRWPFAHEQIPLGGPIHDAGAIHNCIAHRRCF